MSWLRAARWITALVALALADPGCLPNRGAVSPDGRTFYFSLNKDAGFEAKDGTNIYALDVESGRIKAMTDGPQTKGWCSISSDGKFLAYSILGSYVMAINLEDGNVMPLSSVFQHYSYPWVVAGEPQYVVAAAQKSKDEMRWALFGDQGDVPLTPLADFTAGGGNVGVGPSRFAVPASRTSKSGEKDVSEMSVWVVDLSNPPEAEGEGETKAAAPKADTKSQAPAEAAKAEGKAPASPAKPWPAITCAAKWTEDATDKGGGGIDLAFSPDGKRLVAAVSLAGGDKEQGAAKFFDVDPTGKEQPKLLFEVPGGRSPQLTPDGSGIVYLQQIGEEEGTEVAFWRPDMKEARVIARLPGKIGKAYTTCFWPKDGGMRIYHVADEGLWLIDAAADGSDAKARRLPQERMAAQKYLADFERALSHMPDAPPKELPEPLAGAVNAVEKPLQDAAKPVQDALKAAWAAASVWDSVPAAGPLGSVRKAAAESMIALKLIADAAQAYAKDNGGRLPPADAYPGALKKYLGLAEGEPFKMPDGKVLAMNAALAGRRIEEIPDASAAILFFEAKLGGPLVGGRELLRELAGDQDGYVVAFADGHVEWLSQEELAKKAWGPATGGKKDAAPAPKPAAEEKNR